MDGIIVPIISSLVSLGVGFGLGYKLYSVFSGKKMQAAENEAKSIIEKAKKDAAAKKKEAELDAKALLYKMRNEFDAESKKRKEELNGLEKRLMQREENLERRLDLLEAKEHAMEKKEEQISAFEREIKEKEADLSKVLAEEKNMLQRISGMSQEEAKNLLMKLMEQELAEEKSKRIHLVEEEIKQYADKKSREIISSAIQKYAAEHTVENTMSVVSLPSDEMKGRIIGREGRNIRAFEMATGIDVIIDDTPEVVTLSGFNPIRREIARLALQKLVSDGRIHPGRIEEVVEKARQDVEENIIAEGEQAVFDAGIHGEIHSELVKLIGRLKFRSSYGQNALQHSKEVAFIMGVMASELGLDPTLAKRIGLLHDIGKAIDREVEGTHALLGAELANKYGENDIVVNAIASHHEEEEPKSVYAVLAASADAVSASRPGARRETIEAYVKRLKKLEQIATSFKGISKAYAIQAGREVRVMVDPGKIDDKTLPLLAYDVKKKIESDMDYPGQVKVVLIRETRSVEYAK